MNKLLPKVTLLLVLLTPAWAAKPMAWDNLMLIKAAAEQGNPEAQFLLGLQYKVGDGIAKDRGEAVKWLRKSAESGYAEAQYALGDFYAALDPADELADLREAEKWLKAAAAQGNTDAQSRLAVLQAKSASPVRPPAAELSGRLEPVEVTEEPAVTVHWSELLSGLRGSEALLVRGFLLEKGIYVNRDMVAAAEAYRGAAVRGDPHGQLWLSSMYEEGRGVPKDPVTAQAWRKLAIGNGSAEAWAATSKGFSGLSARDEAAETSKWSLLLSGLRGAEALLVRGFILENGIHVPRDLASAADNYRRAAIRGDERGQLFLDAMQARNRIPAVDKLGSVSKAGTAETTLETPVPVKKP